MQAVAEDHAFRRVVCGVDGSPQGLTAVRQALAIAELEAQVWGVSAWDPSLAFQAGIHRGEVALDLRRHAREALSQLEEELPQVRPLLVEGGEVAAVLAAVSNLQADLVCVGASGLSRAAGILFGSVATAMAHHAPCSVLVARDAGPDFPKRILHANDGSPESLLAAEHAARLAVRYGATLVSLHVGEDATSVGEQVAEIARISGAEPVFESESGSPYRRIVEAAHRTHASLVVIGSRGQTGVAALGSVSERVTHHAECSVLVVRPVSHPVFDLDASSSG
jgi:nucleotide-binding universal stress UspA family protein